MSKYSKLKSSKAWQESKRKRYIKNIACYSLVLFFILVFLFPYFFMVSSAFKSRLDAFSYPPKFFWFKPTLENFISMIYEYNLTFYLKNSGIIAVISTLITLLLAIPASYSIARFRFKYRDEIAYSFLIIQTIPVISVVFAFFFIAKLLSLLDTYLILIVGNLLWNVPWAIWMMRGFIESIPLQIEEAAIVDGCSQLGAFCRVILPLTAPGLAATGIFIFIACWNDFTLAFFLTSTRARTLPTTIAFFLTHAGIKWGPMFATATIGTTPVIIFALILRKYLVSALTFGAVKE